MIASIEHRGRTKTRSHFEDPLWLRLSQHGPEHDRVERPVGRIVQVKPAPLGRPFQIRLLRVEFRKPLQPSDLSRLVQLNVGKRPVAHAA